MRRSGVGSDLGSYTAYSRILDSVKSSVVTVCDRCWRRGVTPAGHADFHCSCFVGAGLTRVESSGVEE